MRGWWLMVHLLPRVRDIDAHLDNPDYAGGIWGVVDFDITPYFGKSVRFNATLPEQLLERIDQTVRRDQRYSSRSDFWPPLRYANCRHNL
jgi:hypothetical protein